MVYLEDKGVYVDQAKWEKCKELLHWIKREIQSCLGPAIISPTVKVGINWKELERKRGFLVYVSRTYPSMVPYLKGIHQALDEWRKGRDNNGWQLHWQNSRQPKTKMMRSNIYIPKLHLRWSIP